MVKSGIYSGFSVIFHNSGRKAVIIKLINIACDQRIGHLSFGITDNISYVNEMIFLVFGCFGTVKKNVSSFVVDFSKVLLVGIGHIEFGFGS